MFEKSLIFAGKNDDGQHSRVGSEVYPDDQFCCENHIFWLYNPKVIMVLIYFTYDRQLVFITV